MKRVLLLITFLVGALSLAAQDPKPGSIEGVITRAGGTDPIPNVTVAVSKGASSLRALYKATTDPAGKFVIEGVPPDRYNLLVDNEGFYRSQRSGPLTVDIRSGERIRDIRVSMTPVAVVSGKILDENGEPAAVSVSLMQVRYQDGNRYVGRDIQTATLPTDDKGEFRIPRVRTGRYFIYAKPVDDNHTFSPVFFPGVPNVEDATAIEVGPGADLRGFEFQLLHKDTHKVRLKVSAPQLPEGTEVRFNVRPQGRRIQGEGLSTRFEALPDGTYVSDALGAGQYLLDVDARVPSPTRWPVYEANIPFQITDKDIDLGNIALRVGPSIPGKVTFKDVTRPTNPMSVRLTPLDMQSASPPRADVDASGAFLLDRVPLQRLFQVELGIPSSLYVESVRYAGAEVLNTGLTITEDKGPLEIVVTGPGGTVRGMVRNSKEEPHAQIRVVLVPAPDHRGPATRFRVKLSNELGNFDFSNVPAGEYAVLALEDNVFMATDPSNLYEPMGFLRYSDFYEDPEFLREYESKAVKVRVERAGTHNVTVHSVVVPGYR
jgi:hypothetical protein